MYKTFKLGFIFTVLLAVNATRSKRTVKIITKQEFNEENKNLLEKEYEHDEARRTRSKAIVELLEVLGLKNTFVNKENAKQPPKYMVDLYKAVADDQGITRVQGLLNADMVRSIPNKENDVTKKCLFDLSAIGLTEIIADAELHFYQSRQSLRNLKHAVCRDCSLTNTRLKKEEKISSYLIRIYKTIINENRNKPRKVLVSARRIPLHVSGWLIFPLFNIVKESFAAKETNLSLHVEVSSTNGDIIENILDRHTLAPILIVFTNQSKEEENLLRNHLPTEQPKELKNKEHPKSSKILSRIRRATQGKKKFKQNKEQRNEKDSKHKKKPRVSKVEEESSNNKKEIRKTIKDENYSNEQRKETKMEDEKEFVEYEYEWNESLYDYQNQNQKPTSSYDDKIFPGSNKPPIPDYVSDEKSKSEEKYQSFSSDGSLTAHLRGCRRYPLFVDFEEMGWSGWIIHPSGYNAYHCKGKCSFPLSQHLNPTNHATVQSIMHTLGLGNQPVEMPCCAPDKLYDINLLYFDHNDYVVLRRYKDMVVASCACR